MQVYRVIVVGFRVGVGIRRARVGGGGSRFVTVGVSGDSRGMGFHGVVSGRGRVIMIGVGGDRGWYIISRRDRGRDRLVGLGGGVIYRISTLIYARDRRLSRFRLGGGSGYPDFGDCGGTLPVGCCGGRRGGILVSLGGGPKVGIVSPTGGPGFSDSSVGWRGGTPVLCGGEPGFLGGSVGGRCKDFATDFGGGGCRGYVVGFRGRCGWRELAMGAA